MVYVFGLDIPLIEVFVVLTFFALVTIVILVIMLLKQRSINSKLDEMLAEEHEIKQELDLTKMEEDKQLLLMKQLVRELGSLHLISKKKQGEMEKLTDISTQVQNVGPGNEEQAMRMLQTLLAQVANVDRVVQKESQQLDYITSVVAAQHKQMQTELNATHQQVEKQAAELNKAQHDLHKAQALDRIRHIR